MRHEPLRDHRLARGVVVLAAVQAQALRLIIGGDWTVDLGGGDRVVQQLHVMAVRALVREPDRDPCGVREDRALGPLLALSVGFGPVFEPPSGALVIAPSAARNDQSMPTVASYSNNP